jgi:putative transposase
MPQSLVQIFVHLVFSTKHRAPVLSSAVRHELHPYLAAILRDNGCLPLCVGGVEDHVHLLFGLSRVLSLSKVVEIVKTSSSKWMKTKGEEYAQFYWQGGYGAFSVDRAGIEVVTRYIENQENHHKRETFQHELLEFLKQHQIIYDERYLWD